MHYTCTIHVIIRVSSITKNPPKHLQFIFRLTCLVWFTVSGNEVQKVVTKLLIKSLISKLKSIFLLQSLLFKFVYACSVYVACVIAILNAL